MAHTDLAGNGGDGASAAGREKVVRLSSAPLSLFRPLLFLHQMLESIWKRRPWTAMLRLVGAISASAAAAAPDARQGLNRWLFLPHDSEAQAHRDTNTDQHKCRDEIAVLFEPLPLPLVDGKWCGHSEDDEGGKRHNCEADQTPDHRGAAHGAGGECNREDGEIGGSRSPERHRYGREAPCRRSLIDNHAVPGPPAMLQGIRRGIVVMMMPMASKPPDEEAEARQHQHTADDVTLLRLKCVSKLQPHEHDDARDDNRGQHMPHRREEAHPCDPSDAPALCPSDHSRRHPVIGQDGVQEADYAGGYQEKRNRSRCHCSVLSRRIRGMVGQTLPHMIGVILRLAEKRRHMLIIDGVILGCPIPSDLHHASIAQQAEMVRHRRLGYTGNDRQITDAEGSAPERIEDASTRRVGKGTEGLDYHRNEPSMVRSVEPPEDAMAVHHGALSSEHSA